MINNKFIVSLLLIMTCIAASCIKKVNLYREDPNRKQEVIPQPDFFYPFAQETQSKYIEIIIHTKTDQQVPNITAQIPPLKYNKKWLFMLTQDDCKHAAFSCTWAAINGKALSTNFYYSVTHLQVGDLPSDYYYLGKTLGTTDGTGREVRFSFTTTLAAEWNYMKGFITTFKNNKKDNYRFAMEDGLLWGNVQEMLNYGVGIAFHDLLVNNNEKTVPKLIEHYGLAQNIILDKLNGRGCKMLAEPNGERIYIEAAKMIPSITTITAQASGLKLKPFQQENDLCQTVIERAFHDKPALLKKTIEQELTKNYYDRTAIYEGVHNTDTGWVDFLVWLNDTYGKDGDDTVWMPNQEEYYEYNYHRVHSHLKISKINAYTWKITTTLNEGKRGGSYFYYPSITINALGIRMEDIERIEVNDDVTGLSYADINNDHGIMLNIDCRSHLPQHAKNFVKRHEKDPSVRSNKADAFYFVNMLKDSQQKTDLLKRIN